MTVASCAGAPSGGPARGGNRATSAGRQAGDVPSAENDGLQRPSGLSARPCEAFQLSCPCASYFFSMKNHLLRNMKTCGALMAAGCIMPCIFDIILRSLLGAHLLCSSTIAFRRLRIYDAGDARQSRLGEKKSTSTCEAVGLAPPAWPYIERP